jgi:hypothetical protein
MLARIAQVQCVQVHGVHPDFEGSSLGQQRFFDHLAVVFAAMIASVTKSEFESKIHPLNSSKLSETQALICLSPWPE